MGTRQLLQHRTSDHRTPQASLNPFLRGLLIAVAGIASIKFARDTFYNGVDFEIYWSAARALINGHNPYTYLADPNRPGLVFKYAPWTLTILGIFSLPPLHWAKGLWGVAQAACLWAAGGALWRKHKIPWELVTLVTLAYWGIWVSHFQMGQIPLLILAVCVWFWSPTPSQQVIRGLFLSTKVTSVVALMGEIRTLKKPKTIALGLLWVLILTLPVMFLLHQGLASLLTDWVTSAGSGGSQLEGAAVRGWGNQGFPALVLRRMQAHADWLWADLGVFLMSLILIAPTWAYFSRSLSPRQRWFGWLAVSVITHPLAWFHLFALTLPLACSALLESWKSGNPKRLACAIIGIAWTGGWLSKGWLGEELATHLFNGSIKSWGVVLMGAALVWRKK